MRGAGVLQVCVLSQSSLKSPSFSLYTPGITAENGSAIFAENLPQNKDASGNVDNDLQSQPFCKLKELVYRWYSMMANAFWRERLEVGQRGCQVLLRRIELSFRATSGHNYTHQTGEHTGSSQGKQAATKSA